MHALRARTTVQGTLGGLYTTVEGLLRKIKDNLIEANPFAGGDSARSSMSAKYAAFFAGIDALLGEEGENTGKVS